MAKSNQRTVLVTGATGHQGGAAMRHLRERGFLVRALTREPNRPEARHLVGHGTEVARGSFDDPGSLTRPPRLCQPPGGEKHLDPSVVRPATR